MVNENIDQEVRRTGSQDQPDRSFGSSKEQSTSTDKGSMNSGRQQQQGGATEADDELASDASARESVAKKPL